MTKALEVHGLTVRAAQHPALAPIVNQVSLVLDAGRRLTILGESGSGKSVLAQAIMGTLPPGLIASGEISVWGTRLPHGGNPTPLHQALWGRQIALLPQEPWNALDPTMQARAQVAEVGRHVLGQDWSAAWRNGDAALVALRLSDALNKYPHQLSGGMAQRVAIAASCASGARLLIADEPTKGLDATMRDQVAELLVAHLYADHALITITHDVALARRLGGDVAVMLNGHLIEHGPATRLLEQPQHAYSRALIAAEPAQWHRMVKPVPAGAATVVAADSVSKAYGPNQLFSDVSLSIAAGETIAVAGPSGCGKTTLGHILMGLTRPDRGTVAWPGAARPNALQKLYQDPPSAFAPRRRLRDSLSDLISLHRLSRVDASNHMAALALGNALLDRLPSEVSGGELQRFALLRVLLLKPALVFADEPTSRLDPITQERAMRVLCSEAAAHRFGVMLVTHDQDIAAKAAHRMVSVSFGTGHTP